MYPPAFAKVGTRSLRAARANRAFCTDKKRIRTESTVTVNSREGVRVLYKIVDCAWMGSYPCAIGDPRGRFFVRAKSKLCN
jgi:hypothetical protein